MSRPNPTKTMNFHGNCAGLGKYTVGASEASSGLRAGTKLESCSSVSETRGCLSLFSIRGTSACADSGAKGASALANSAMSPNRSCGIRCKQRRTTFSSCSGQLGQSFRRGVGSPWSTRAQSRSVERSANGSVPATNSCKMTPRAHISVAGVASLAEIICSGDI